MVAYTPRLRMFAGPNGSGKSTIKSLISADLLGIYINPDDIQYQIQKHGYMDFSEYQVIATKEEIAQFFNTSLLIQKAGLGNLSTEMKFEENRLRIPKSLINSYLASVLSDFIRRKLIDYKKSFTFETVMSSFDKIEFVKTAQKSGFRTYLYYIATDDPLINISRIAHRVKTGGHSVPKDKIISRFERSVNLLPEAIKYTNRAYIFDNSSEQPILLAEITNGKHLELKAEVIPIWFKKTLLEKFDVKLESK
jgi:predicted ABC-type ATPase